MKILISTSSFGKFDNKPLEMLKSRGYDVVLNPHKRKVTPEELVDLARDCDAVIAGTEQYNKEVFEKLPNLKVISRCGVGMDSIDINESKKHGIVIKNTPDAPTQAVAELTVLLILDVLRKTSFMDRQIRKGIWKKEMGHLLAEKTVGIVGLGRIGRRVAELLAPFNVKLLASDPKPDKIWLDKNKVEITELDRLLKESDIVTLHVPYLQETKNLINSERVALMKEGAIIVNAARGGVVDENAIYNALKNGRLYGAALDVMEKEPYNGPLKDLDNVVLTPHIGSYAIEARVRMETEAVKNLFEGLSEVQ